MRTVCKKNQCVGCMACVDICPKNAIKVIDEIKAYNAYIQEDLCVNCNACFLMCQNNNKPTFIQPIQWKQGWATDEAIRMASSSGGIATAISQSFIENGGVVFSCTFIKGKFVFRMADNIQDLKMFVGSKYVKSNPEGVYKYIRDGLNNDQKILFIGLPCQVSAVKNFIKKTGQLKNLYTIDLICHGSPSPKIIDLFLKQYGYSLETIDNIEFRVKNNFQISNKGKTFTPKGTRDKYLIAFLNTLIYTENCYQCQYAKTQRVSDITLGDSWGSSLSKEDIKKGISLVLCQTEKGKALLTYSNVTLFDVNIKNSIKCNHQLTRPSIKPKKREKFFDGILSGKNFNSLVKRCIPKQCYRQDIKALLTQLHLIKKYDRIDYRTNIFIKK